jgi:hypothetical protein
MDIDMTMDDMDRARQQRPHELFSPCVGRHALLAFIVLSPDQDKSFSHDASGIDKTSGNSLQHLVLSALKLIFQPTGRLTQLSISLSYKSVYHKKEEFLRFADRRY